MSSAADMFAQSVVDALRSINSTQDSAELNAAVQGLVAERDAFAEQLKLMEDDNAANLAEKYALRQQLARYAPDHPLLVNKLLIEKLHMLGIRAYSVNRNFGDARDIGKNYYPPGFPPIK